MKKILSTLVSALVAVSFAGIVCAAEPTPTPASATGPTAGQVKKEEKKPVKKHKKTKKCKTAKKPVKKEEAKPAEAPAPPAAK
jgi:hypothetical protein